MLMMRPLSMLALLVLACSAVAQSQQAIRDQLLGEADDAKHAADDFVSAWQAQVRRVRTIVTAMRWACCAMLLGGCEGIENGAPEAGAQRSLSGNVVYRERMALPPGATVEVWLEDVSIADAAAPVIARQSITPGAQQVPIPFRLEIPAGAMEPNHRYGVRAEIRTPTGELLFTTTEHHAVLGPEPPAAGIDILVRRTEARAGGAGPLGAGPWQLAAIQRVGQSEEPVGAAPAYTIEFGPDGQFFGQAHCNRYTGGYTTPAADRLEMTAGATTLMACPEPSTAEEYLRMLSAVSRYEMRGDRLWLMAEDGAALGFARGGAAIVDGGAGGGAPEVGRTFVFDCDGGESFTVRSGPREAALWLPESLGGESLVLGQTAAASGARYEDGDTVYWNKADVATFEIGGQTFADCRHNQSKVPWADAARRGVAFRAIGNEPSWHIEITPERLAMITDLGARRTEAAYEAPMTEGQRTTYRAVGADIVAVIERRACRDTMSGEAFEAAATVTFEGTTFHGCGRFL